MDTSVSAAEALALLRQGNAQYVQKGQYTGNVSPEARRDLKEHGQHPFACVITCSDSRVVPESVFSAGLGELFVIRIAGNVVDEFVLGSVEYAVEHLGAPLVMVLGHTECGAVAAALGHTDHTHIASIVTEIQEAIGSEHNPNDASSLNVKHSVSKIASQAALSEDVRARTRIVGGMYDIETGEVEFYEDQPVG